MRGTAAYLITALLLFTTSVVKAQELDSAYLARVKDTVDRYYDRHPRKRLSSEDRRFAVMPLYGVMYTQETGLLAMGGFMGSYRSSADTLVPESSVGAVAMLSVNLSGAGAVMGKWYSGPGNFLLEYSVIFKNSPRRFWGLGYADASDEGNLTSFTGRNLRAEAQFLYRGGRRVLAGGLAGYDYSDAVDFGSDALVDGLPLRSHYLYAGVRFSYDSRDDTSEPSRGVFLEAVQKLYLPLVDVPLFASTEVTADFYFALWKGCVAAVDLYGAFTSHGAPWMLWPLSGGDVRLRGYYQGRYRDRNLMSAQIELRQHVYGGHGVVVWGGAGNVFPSFRSLDIKRTLPTYGAGYRFSIWGIVFRLDAGFGTRGQWSLTAGVNHSF